MTSRYLPLFVLLILMVSALLAPDAHASSAGDLLWESSLEKIRISLSGPVASSLAVIGCVVSGCMLIFGGEINQFAKSGVMLALVVSFIVGANSIITNLFSVSSAVVS